MITHHTADQAPATEGADAPAAADPPDAVPSSTRLASFVVVVAPFAAFIVAIVWLWGWGIGRSPLIVLAAMAVLTTLGITVGYHRLFPHRSFQTTGPVQAVLTALGSMAAEGPVVKWAAVHRLHHQHSDTPRVHNHEAPVKIRCPSCRSAIGLKGLRKCVRSLALADVEGYGTEAIPNGSDGRAMEADRAVDSAGGAGRAAA